MEQKEVVKFSESISNSFAQLYKAGGLALVFVFSGVVMILVGHFYTSKLSEWIFGIGVFLTIACLALFLYMQLKTPIKTMKVINENKETIDALQNLALQLTHFAYTMQAFSFKHIQKIDTAVNLTYSIVKNIPLIGEKVRQTGLPSINIVSRFIVDTTIKSETVIKDIETSLKQCDFRKLNKYSEDVNSIIKTLNNGLKQ